MLEALIQYLIAGLIVLACAAFGLARGLQYGLLPKGGREFARNGIDRVLGAAVGLMLGILVGSGINFALLLVGNLFRGRL